MKSFTTFLVETEDTRNLFLNAVEEWIEGTPLTDPKTRQALVNQLLVLSRKNQHPKSQPSEIYRAISIPHSEYIKLLNDRSDYVLKDMYASSWSKTRDLAEWFYDEIRKPAILIRKENIQKVIVDIQELRDSMTDTEKNEYELLAFDHEDEEVIVVDDTNLLTISYEDVIRFE